MLAPMFNKRFFPHLILLPLILSGLAASAAAAGPPCRPCAGVHVASPEAALGPLVEDFRLEDEQRLYVSWSVTLDGSADAAAMESVLSHGGTPWIIAHFQSPAPILEHTTELEAELRDLARLASAASDRAHFQIDWTPPGEIDAKDYAYLFKRAAVTVTGGRNDARVLVGPLPADAAWLRRFYGEDVAAYVDGIALVPSGKAELAAAVAAILDLDPGKGIVLDSLPWPEAASETLARAAEASAEGVAVTFFDRPQPSAEDLRPLKVLAREFQGDLSLDPSTVPSGAKNAWTFVRGDDLSLRVIAETGGQAAELKFDDPQLKSPREISLDSGEEEMVFGQRRSSSGIVVPVEGTQAVSLVRLDRMTAAEIEGLEGLEERVDVEDTRQVPVEEILRQLQAFEDDQARKLTTYTARNTLHLRFLIGSGAGTVEASYEGPFFFRRGEGFDWVWETFYVDGVKWKGKKIPEIPLIQPEKAASLPLEIHFTKDYSYRLRGTATIEGRDCWVVDFEPVAVVAGSGLYQGTVWIDRQVYARVKTRAIQLGLEGDVISNEESVFFTPVDENGQPAPWAKTSFVLPTRIVGQQLLSVLNATVPVEKESQLTSIHINPESFDREREAAWASESTMVRDTDKGLRYLVPDKEGKREVKEELDTTRLFIAGGVFYDESVDYPIPLAGVNYLALDWRGSGKQLNFLFAGPLLTLNLAEPRLFDSRWDAGINAFGFFINRGDQLYRDGREIITEEVESKTGSVSVFLGHPLGSFTKLDFTYTARYDKYSDASDTDEAFVLPSDTLTHVFRTELSYNRSGWRFKLDGSFHSRSDWEPWGIPDLETGGFSPSQLQAFDAAKDYVRWQATFAKSFWLKRFMKLSVELEHLDGQDLDRFSRYDFGIFGDSSVAGYPSGLVRADKADGVHLDYGLNLGNVIRVQLEGDAVWATNEETGLDNELLGGVGLEGSLALPWQMLVNFQIGQAVAGPGDGIAARIVFLKLFPQKK